MLVAGRARRPHRPDSAHDRSAGDRIPRLLVLQHCPVTPIGRVGEVAAARGAALVTLFPHRGERMPPTDAGFDGLVILGGPMHAGDDINHPAFRPMLRLIRRFHAAGKPVFGICLGAQLIARAFGETVWPFGGIEVGFLPLEITAEGQRDRLLAGLAPTQRLMQLHEDSFGLPAGAVLLMRNDVCTNQAFRLGAATYGFQFHLEVIEADARNFPRDCWAAMRRHYGEAAEAVEAEVLRQIERHYAEGAAFCETVTERWLELVEERAAAAPLRRTA